jgi:hypothetical protein
MGVRRWDYAIAIAIPVSIVIAVSFAQSRQREAVSRARQCFVFVMLMLASMGLSRLFGPLILMPVMIAVAIITVQAHPDEQIRRFGLVAGTIAILLPVGLEFAGILPSSYAFTGDRIEILPQLVELPRGLTVGFLAIAGAAAAIAPGMFVSRLRAELTESQRRELLQTYHLRRLGENIVRV